MPRKKVPKHYVVIHSIEPLRILEGFENKICFHYDRFYGPKEHCYGTYGVYEVDITAYIEKLQHKLLENESTAIIQIDMLRGEYVTLIIQNN